MSHGPRIKPEVRDMIWDEALDRPERHRDDVAQKLQDDIGRYGYPVPEFDTLKKMISKARTSKRPSPEDEAWQLASLQKNEVPPGALSALVEVWKLKLALGSSLTIRQAKWVVRLQALVGDPNRLRLWAEMYAKRELTSEAQRKPLHTSDLDIALTMGSWEAAAACLTGRAKVPRLSGGQVLMPLPYSASSFDTAVGAARGPMLAWTAMSMLRPGRAGIPSIDGSCLFDEMERTLERCRQAFAPSPEAPWVFLHWLTYLANGPKWQSLGPRRIKSILDQLITWVGNEVSKDPEPSSQHSATLCDEYDLLTTPGLRPTRLLKAVGYHVPTPSYAEYLRTQGVALTRRSDKEVVLTRVDSPESKKTQGKKDGR